MSSFLPLIGIGISFYQWFAPCYRKPLLQHDTVLTTPRAGHFSLHGRMLPSVAVKGITIKYELGAAEFAEGLFGVRPADDDLACLAGALDGATVNVSVRVKKDWLYLAVDDPTRFDVYETSLRRDAQGELFAYIHEVRVAVGQGRQGLGIRAFSRQVRGAGMLGGRASASMRP